MYVGRAFHNGDTLVAKVIPSKHVAYISWRGEEVAKSHFEVLCGSNLAWQHCYDHTIPPHAVLCGQTALGQPVYIGRGHYEGSLTVGKVSSVHRALFIAFGGAERRLNSYEILVADSPNGAGGWTAPPDLKPPPPYPTMEMKPPIEELPPPLPLPLPLPQPPSYDPPPPYVPPVMHVPVQPPLHSLPPHFDSSSTYDTWVSGSGSYTPPYAVHAGHDSDLSPLYVCRAFHNGELLPGKAVPSHGCAYVSFQGEEIAVHHYEMLVGDRYHWVAAEDGNIAPGAVEAGRTATGEPLFVGRAHYCGSLTPGKVHRSHQCLYLPFAGRERRVNRYEVLVRKDDYFRHQGLHMAY